MISFSFYQIHPENSRKLFSPAILYRKTSSLTSESLRHLLTRRSSSPKKPNKREKFLESLPYTFDKAEYLEIAKELNIIPAPPKATSPNVSKVPPSSATPEENTSTPQKHHLLGLRKLRVCQVSKSPATCVGLRFIAVTPPLP